MKNISSPFPQAVAFAVVESSSVRGSELPPEEQKHASLIRSPKRVASFLAGREAAHACLRQLGEPDRVPILSGLSGEPIWPAGVTGSISHSCDIAAAAVCRTSSALSLGLDVETLRAEPYTRLLERVSSSEEREALYTRGSQEVDEGVLPLLLFSIKESVYKALFPLVKRKFWFGDVRLKALVQGWAELEVRTALSPVFIPGTVIEACYAANDKMLVSGVLIPDRENKTTSLEP